LLLKEEVEYINNEGNEVGMPPPARLERLEVAGKSGTTQREAA
jgi:hypothetical protein